MEDKQEKDLLQEKEQLIILEGQVNYLQGLVGEMYAHDIECKNEYLNNLHEFKKIIKSLRRQIDEIQA